MSSNDGFGARDTRSTLRRSEEGFRLLVESVVDYAIFRVSPEGIIETWNAGAERIKGYTASEIIGQHFSKFYPERDVQAGKCEWELDTAIEQGRFEEEGIRLRKDGSPFWANIIITPLYDEGMLIGFAKVTRDLTERRKAEEHLRQSEERFRLIVDSVKDYAIFMLDREGMVVTWNLGAERILGYTAQEAIGRHVSSFYVDEHPIQKADDELSVAAAHGRFEEEGYRVRKDGEQIWANVVLTSVHDADGALIGFAKVVRDLTFRREAEQERLRLAQEQEANRVKDEFLATVSHELRTPLMAILGWSSLLAGRLTDPEGSKALNTIRRNAQAQARIIDDLLDVSRIITGQLRLDVKPVDLVAVVRDAIEVIRPAAASKSVEIVENLAPHILLVGDASRLQQVAWNLLHNALKFSEASGRIEVELAQAGARVKLTVTDRGRGIDPSFLPHVFERFKQADSSTTRKYGGLGLGLAIVRQLTELHGGSVVARSLGLGKGASFEVTLPVRVIAPRSEPVPGLSPPSVRPLEGVRVLIVDDEPDARELVATLLAEHGADTETAASAEEARQRLQQRRPHVLVSDIGLPGEDGHSLIRSVRRLQRSQGGGVPAIALTAYVSQADRRAAFDAGFNNHLGKPVDPEELLSVVRNLASLARSE